MGVVLAGVDRSADGQPASASVAWGFFFFCLSFFFFLFVLFLRFLFLFFCFLCFLLFALFSRFRGGSRTRGFGLLLLLGLLVLLGLLLLLGLLPLLLLLSGFHLLNDEAVDFRSLRWNLKILKLEGWQSRVQVVVAGATVAFDEALHDLRNSRLDLSLTCRIVLEQRELARPHHDRARLQGLERGSDDLEAAWLVLESPEGLQRGPEQLCRVVKLLVNLKEIRLV